MKRYLKRGATSEGGQTKNPNGLMEWFSVLKGIKDNDLKLICGTDVALYIVFLRLSAKFFAILTILNCAIFMPIYITGYPANENDVKDKEGRTSLISLITIINITGYKEKVMAIYVLMTSIYVLCVFGFMYFYWKRSVEWRYKKHSHKDKFMDHDIALHSIMITNLQ